MPRRYLGRKPCPFKLGELWATKSDGKGLFLLAEERDVPSTLLDLDLSQSSMPPDVNLVPGGGPDESDGEPKGEVVEAEEDDWKKV